MLGFSPISSGPISTTSGVAHEESTVASVSVTPGAPSVAGGATQGFTAVVTGDGSPSQAVEWSSNAGAISLAGVFTAPAATASIQTVIVTATSLQDESKSGTAIVTIPAEEDVVVPPEAAPRFARPTSTVTSGPWLPSSGTSLADMIDEPSADSADYISATSAGACEIALNPVTDPGTSSGQVVRYQVWSPSGSGLLVRLKQGAVIIADWNHASLPTVATIYAQTLSPSECDSITNYADLRFEFVAG